MDLKIRSATGADAADWLRLRRELWPDEDAEEMASETRRFFEGEPGLLREVLLAEAGGEVIGFAEVSTRPYAEGCVTSPVGFLEGWYVAAPWRRRGVGRALMEAAENWARSEGLTEFASDTTLGNEQGEAAHLALGFIEAERLISFAKEIG